MTCLNFFLSAGEKGEPSRINIPPGKKGEPGIMGIPGEDGQDGLPGIFGEILMQCV